jgi:hypothetical protein
MVEAEGEPGAGPLAESGEPAATPAPLIGVESLAKRRARNVSNQPLIGRIALVESDNLGLGPERSIWPPRLGLLARPRDQWTAAEWQQYAELLEREGFRLIAEIERARALEATIKARHSRSRSPSQEPDRSPKRMPPTGFGLIDALDYLPRSRKPGRPSGSVTKTVAEAQAALMMKEQMKAAAAGSSRAISDEKAIVAMFRSMGKPDHYARGRLGAVKTAMSRLRGRKGQ